MERFAFDKDGITKYTTAIYGLTDDQLYNEAIKMAEDFTAHIAKRFALQVHQLEYLREIDRNFSVILGWHLATAMLCRRPVSFMFTQDGESSDCEAKFIMASSKMAVHYNAGTISAEGVIRIQFCNNTAV